MKSSFTTKWIALGLTAVTLLSACEKDKDPVTPVKKNDDSYATQKREIKENYATIVHASYQDSYTAAVELQIAIDDFVSTPTATSFELCKTKWLAAREPYGQTEAYRFANGPIDDMNGPEGDLNAWPLDEGYIDYISADASAGIINDTANYPNLTQTILAEANEEGSEKNISIGYHAIEFLLWGQDSPNTSLKTPGNRPYTDYLTTAAGTAENQARRAEYLKVAAKVLVQDLKKMVTAWEPNNSSNYRAEFMEEDNAQSLKDILTGIGTLSKSELAGERMFVALNNQDQEDEHSCFSDNTHRDIILNAQGIRNVYLGEYNRTDGTTISGTSIQDLITLIDPVLATEMDDLSSKSMTQAKAIPVPFDHALTQESVGGNGPIMETIRTLQTQGDKIAEIAAVLGLSISTN